jgi:nucleotide-binding universal stress UspA family protein
MLPMGQNILVAFDDSENAMRAVEFIVKTFSTDNRVTLFNVAQDTAALCEMNSPELTDYFLSQQSAFCALEDKKKRLVEIAMEKARAIFLNAGFDDKHIKLKIQVKKKGVARDIVNESESGFDLVILGRKGVSGVKEFFFGSVAQKVLQAADGIAVLVVS